MRYGNHGTVISLFPFSTAFTIAFATSSASITKRRMQPAAELRALREALRLDESGHDRVYLDPLGTEQRGG